MLKSLIRTSKIGYAFMRANSVLHACVLLLTAATFSLSITSCTSQQAVVDATSGTAGLTLNVSGGGQKAGARAVFLAPIQATLTRDGNPVAGMGITFSEVTKTGVEIFTKDGLTDASGTVSTRIKAPNKYNETITILVTASTGDSKTITVNTTATGDAVGFVLTTTSVNTAAGHEIAGEPFDFIIRAVDENGNTVPTYNDTITAIWTFDAAASWAANPKVIVGKDEQNHNLGFGYPKLPPSGQQITFIAGVYRSNQGYYFTDSVQPTNIYFGDGPNGLADVFAQPVVVDHKPASKVIVENKVGGPNGHDGDYSTGDDNALAYFADFPLSADLDSQDLFSALIDSVGNYINDVTTGTHWAVTSPSPSTFSPHLTTSFDSVLGLLKSTVHPFETGSATLTVSVDDPNVDPTSRTITIDPGKPAGAGVKTSQTFTDQDGNPLKDGDGHPLPPYINQVQAGKAFDVVVEAQDKHGNKCIPHSDNTANYAAIMNLTFTYTNAVDTNSPHKVSNGCPVFSGQFTKTRKYAALHNCTDVLTEVKSVTMIQGGTALGAEQGILNDTYMNDPDHYLNNLPVEIAVTIPGYTSSANPSFATPLTGHSDKITVVGGDPHHYNPRTSLGEGTMGDNFTCYVEDALIGARTTYTDDSLANCLNFYASNTPVTYYAALEDKGGNVLDAGQYSDPYITADTGGSVKVNWDPNCNGASYFFCNQWAPLATSATVVSEVSSASITPIIAGPGSIILSNASLTTTDKLQTYYRGYINTSPLDHFVIAIDDESHQTSITAINHFTLSVTAKDNVGNTLYGYGNDYCPAPGLDIHGNKKCPNINLGKSIKVRFWNLDCEAGDCSADINHIDDPALEPSLSGLGTPAVLPFSDITPDPVHGHPHPTYEYHNVQFTNGTATFANLYLPNAADKIHIQMTDGSFSSNIIGDPAAGLNLDYLRIDPGPVHNFKIRTGPNNTGEDWTGTPNAPTGTIVRNADQFPVPLYVAGYDAEFNFRPEAFLAAWSHSLYAWRTNTNFVNAPTNTDYFLGMTPNTLQTNVNFEARGARDLYDPLKPTQHVTDTGQITVQYQGYAAVSATLQITPGANARIQARNAALTTDNNGNIIINTYGTAGVPHPMHVTLTDLYLNPTGVGNFDKPITFSWAGTSGRPPERRDGNITDNLSTVNSTVGNTATYFHFVNGVVTPDPQFTFYAAGQWPLAATSAGLLAGEGEGPTINGAELDHFWVYNPASLSAQTSDYILNPPASLSAHATARIAIMGLDEYSNNTTSDLSGATFSLTSGLRGETIHGTIRLAVNDGAYHALSGTQTSISGRIASDSGGIGLTLLDISADQAGSLTYTVTAGSPKHPLDLSHQMDMSIHPLSTIDHVGFSKDPPAQYTASNTNAMAYFTASIFDMWDNIITTNNVENITVGLSTTDPVGLAPLPTTGYGTSTLKVTAGSAVFADFIYPRVHPSDTPLDITATDEHSHTTPTAHTTVNVGAVTYILPILTQYQAYTGGVVDYASAVHPIVSPSPLPSTIPDRPAGTSIPVQLRAVDEGYNTVPNWVGNALSKNVVAMSTDPNWVAPTWGHFVNGIFNSSITDTTAGNGHVISSQTSVGTNLESPPYNVTSLPTTTLVVQLPGQTLNQGAANYASAFGTTVADAHSAGTEFNVDVFATDDYFNVKKDTDGAHVKLTATQDANATVGGVPISSVTQVLANGTAHFTNVKYLKAMPNPTNGTSQTIIASSTDQAGTLKNTHTNYLAVTPLAASQTIVQLPGQSYNPGAHAGALHTDSDTYPGLPAITNTPSVGTTDGSFLAKVYAVDTYYNTDPGYIGDVSLLSTYGQDGIVGPPLGKFIFGYAGFTVSPVKSGTGHLSPNSTLLLPPGTRLSDNNSDNYNVAHGNALRLLLLMPNQTFSPGQAGGSAFAHAVSNQVTYPNPMATEVAGVSYDVVVNAVDAKFNLINDDSNSMINFNQDDYLAPNISNQALVNGTTTFHVVSTTAGSNAINIRQVGGTAFSYFSPALYTMVDVQHDVATQTVIAVDNQYLTQGATSLAQALSSSISLQGVNKPFRAKVYAVDSYYNIADAAFGATPYTGAVTLTSSDATATLPAPDYFTAGRFYSNNNVTHTTAGTGVTLAAVTADLTNITSGAYDVLPNPPNIVYSTIAGTSGAVADGAPGNYSTVTITIYDDFHNPIQNVLPTFSASNSGNTNTYDACTLTNTSGISTCKFHTRKVEDKVLQIESVNGSNFVKSGDTVTFIGGAAHHLAFQQSPELFVSAGTEFVTQPIVNIVDVNGNKSPGTDSHASNNLVLGLFNDIACSNATFGASLVNGSHLASSSVATFALVKTNNANTYYIGVRDATDATITAACATSTTTVSPTAATQVIFTQESSGTENAGTDFHYQPSARIADQYGNAVGTGDLYRNDVIQLDVFTDAGCSTTPGSSTLTNNTHQASNGNAQFSGVNYTAAQKIYILASDVSVHAGYPSLATTCSTSFVQVMPLAASTTYSSISGTTGITADGTDSSTITITLKDQYQNPLAIGTIPTFSADIPTNNYGTCSGLDANGVSTCSMTSTKIGDKTPQILTPVAVAGKTGPTIHFKPGTPTKILYSPAPSASIVAGSPFSTQPTATITDFYGNTINSTDWPDYDSDNIALTAYTTADCSTTPGGGVVVSGSMGASEGSAAFTGVSYTKSPQNIYLKAADTVNNSVHIPTDHTGLTPACFGPISVTSGAANKLIFTASPSLTATAGSSFGAQPVVQISDSLGNVVQDSNYLGDTIQLKRYAAANCTGSASVAGTFANSSMSASAGTASFGSVSDNKAESVYIRAESTTHSGLVTACTAAPTVVSAAAANATNSSIVGANSVDGTNVIKANNVAKANITITLIDAYGNPLIGQAVAFSATDTGGTNNYSPSCPNTDTNGQSVCSLKSGKYETKWLSITSPISLLNNSSVSFVADTAAKIVFQTPPANTATAGISMADIVVNITDAQGNLASNDTTFRNDQLQMTVYTDSLCSTTLESTGFYITPANATVNASNAVATFTGIARSWAGTVYFKVTDITPSHSLTSACSAGTVIGPTDPNKLVFSPAPAANPFVAGAAFTTPGVVKIQDTYGNLILNGGHNAGTYSTEGITLTAYPQASGGCTGTAIASTYWITGTNSMNAVASVANFTTAAFTLKGGYYFKASNTTNAALTTACAGPYTITAAAPALLRTDGITAASSVTTAPSVKAIVDGTAGSGATFTYTLKDQYGNLAENAITPLFTSSPTTGTTTHSCTATADGTGTSTCTYTTTMSEMKSYVMSYPFSTTLSTTTMFYPGTANKLKFVGLAPSSTATAGVQFAQAPTIEIQDVNGNRMTAAGATAYPTLTGNADNIKVTAYTTSDCSTTASTASPALTNNSVNAVDGTATIPSNLTHYKAEAIFLKASDNTQTLTTACTAASTLVSPNTGTKLAWSNAATSWSGAPPATAVARNNFTAGVQIQDNWGNLVSNTDSITLVPHLLNNCSDGTAGGTITGNVKNATAGQASFTTVTYNTKTPALYFDATATGLTHACSGTGSGTTNSISIKAGTATTNSIVGTIPATATANGTLGSGASFTITLKDQDNNIAEDTVTPTITVSPTTGNQTPVCTATSGGTGVSTCTLKTDKAEVKTYSVSGPYVSNNIGSTTFNPGPANQIVFTGATPANATAGSAIGGTMTFETWDIKGNKITAAFDTGGTLGSTDTITVTAYTNNTCGTASTATPTIANNAVASVDGVATFSNLTHYKAEPLYYYATSSRGFTKCVGGTATTVGPGTVNKIGFTSWGSAYGVSGSATSKTAFGTQPKVYVQDTWGNTITSGTGSTDTITLSGFTDPGCGTGTEETGVLDTAAAAGSAPSMNASSGLATFAGVRSNLVETIYLKATSSRGPTVCSGNGNSTTITPDVPNATNTLITGVTGTTVTADGSNFGQFTVTVRDASGNLVSNGTPVTCSATDTNSTNSCNCGGSPGTTVSGVVTCKLYSRWAEPKTVSVSAGSTPVAITSSHPLITFGPGLAAKVAVKTEVTTATAGTAFGSPARFEVQDTNGNRITTASTLSGSTDSITIAAYTTKACSATTSTTFTGGSYTASDGFVDVTSSPALSMTTTKKETMYLGVSDSNHGGWAVGCSGSATVVSPGAPSKLVFTQFPSSSAQSLVALAQNPIIETRDAWNNVNDTGNGAADTITISGWNENTCTGATPTQSGKVFNATSGSSANATKLAASGVANFGATANDYLKSNKVETFYIKASSSRGGVASACAGANPIQINPASADSTQSTYGAVTQATPVADGTGTASFTVTLKDASGNLVANGTVAPTCAVTPLTGSAACTCAGPTAGGTGTSLCTISTTKAEAKTINLTGTITKASAASTTFVAGLASKLILSATPATGKTAGTSFGTLTGTIQDVNSNILQNVTGSGDAIQVTAWTDPNCNTTGSTTNLTGNSLSATAATGTFSFTALNTTKAETLYLKVADSTQPSVAFACTPAIGVGPGVASAVTSTIGGAASGIADGSTSAAVSVILLDVNSNPISSSTPAFTATNTGATNAYSCGASDATGTAACTLKSSRAEGKVLQLTTPSVTGSTIPFYAIFFQDAYTQPTDAWGPQTTDVSHTYTLKNKSSAATSTIGTISVTGTNPSAWSVQGDNCSGVSLPATTGTCTVTLVYKGSTNASGPYSATISYTASQPNGGTATRNMTGSNP